MYLLKTGRVSRGTIRFERYTQSTAVVRSNTVHARMGMTTMMMMMPDGKQ